MLSFLFSTFCKTFGFVEYDVLLFLFQTEIMYILLPPFEFNVIGSATDMNFFSFDNIGLKLPYWVCWSEAIRVQGKAFS